MEEAGADDLQLSEARLDGIEHAQDEALFDEPALRRRASPLALYRRYDPTPLPRSSARSTSLSHCSEP